jgi:uncharacterized protein YycO
LLVIFFCPITSFAEDYHSRYIQQEKLNDYKELYKEDEIAINEINKNLPKLLEEGKKFAQTDVKQNVLYSSNTLGSCGDIIVNLVIDSGSVGFAGHAAIVSNDYSKTVESYAKNWSPKKIDGVQYYTNNWNLKKGTLLVRPVGASMSQYKKAASYAASQVGKPYNWDFLNKTTTQKYYCSQLVWRAWLNAGINCETGSIPNGIIAPADLVNSSNTYIVKKVQ